MESHETATTPAVADDELQPVPGFPDYRGPAADAGFSEAAWESAIRLYLSTTPSLN